MIVYDSEVDQGLQLICYQVRNVVLYNELIGCCTQQLCVQTK